MRFGLQRRPKTADRALSRRLAKEELAFKKDLIAAREAAGLSQTEVAARLGVNKSAISRFERVDSNPTLSMIRHYAHAVGALVMHRVVRSWSAEVDTTWDETPPDVVTEQLDNRWPVGSVALRVTSLTSASLSASGAEEQRSIAPARGAGAWVLRRSVTA